MAITKISTDTIDLSSDTTALKMPTGTSTSALNVQYLVVAGGGGGSGNTSGGGGGGAGGLLSGTTSITPGTNITVTIGSGGDGTVLETSSAVAGSGGNSIFSTITAIGGGGAANTGASSSADGGSGGGAPGGTAVTAGNGTSGQGNAGGIGSNPSDIGGGGGGAGGVGQPGGTRTGATDGQGGVALANSITGASVLYAGGGGAGVCDYVLNSTPATAGLGGGGVSGTGGDGGQSDSAGAHSVFGNSGVANTGGGGGGGSRSDSGVDCGGGDGGSGTVILRYPTANTLTLGSGLYGNYSTGTTGLCHWPTTSDGISLFELNNNITDTCGTSTASWSGTPAYSTTAKFGSHSAEFSGGTGGTYIDTGVDPDSYSSWTISLWVYRTNTTLYDLIIGSTDGSFFNGFAIGAYNETQSGKFDVYLRNGSGNVFRTIGGSIKFNTWEHIALTHDSDGSGTTTIYHNGKLLTGVDSSYSPNPATGNFASSNNWILGSGGTYNIERLTGNIDQARFYDRVLTAQEIELLYAETSDPTTGVIGSETWSKFLGGTGTVSFLDTGSGTGRPASPDIGTMRENTTTSKMEIYTGAKGWRALQQTGQDVVVVPSNGFGTALYTGNGGADDISLNFQPDLIWIKGRDTNGKFNAVYDSVRGATNMISTNSTDYGTWNPYGSVTPNHAGFAIGSASAGDINTNTENYVSWSWKAGGNSNTFNIDGVGYATAAAAGMNAGSISPNACSVSTEYGFSITKYDTGICGTSNPPCFNWSHGLNQEPDFVTNKMLNYTYGWDTIFKPAGYNGGSNTGGWQYAQLNTNAAMGSSPHYSADSTLLYETMSSGASYPLVTYAWHSVPGYSLISTYTGTGVSTAMPRIYTGFQPAWLMVKRLDSTGWWNIEDSTRNTSNPRDRVLGANSSDAEIISSSYNINFYNNGFQIINNHADWNAAGGEYLFLCFAS